MTSTESHKVSFGKSVYTGYFLSLLYMSNYEDVMDQTKKWKSSGVYRSTLGTFRASAWKRKMENLVENNPSATVDALVRASTILSDVFRNDGYSKLACLQAIKIFEEIQFCFSRINYRNSYPTEGIDLFKFVKNNIFEIKQIINPNGFEVLISKFSEIPLKNSPFSETEAILDSSNNLGFSEDYSKNNSLGLIEVKVKNRTKENSTFIFASDENSNDYFLHYDNLKDGSWKSWCHLGIGQILVVVPEDSTKSGKSILAKEIYIDSY